MANPKPFLKWIGGKTRSADAICELLPRKINVYREGFFGGGAVLFRLAADGRFNSAIVTDVNRELIVTTTAVRDRVDDVMSELQKLLSSPITESRYYRLRASKQRAPAKVAARMIVLNKTGYNGLYRVNRRGELNTPWGKREAFDPDYANLRECSRLLQNVEILHAHYEHAIRGAKQDDAVYLDPPFASSKETDPKFGFRAYSTEKFDSFEQDKVASACRYLTTQGVPWVASNSDTSSVRDRYSFASTRVLEISRNVGAKAETRGKIGELLIWNTPKDDRQVEMFGGTA